MTYFDKIDHSNDTIWSFSNQIDAIGQNFVCAKIFSRKTIIKMILVGFIVLTLLKGVINRVNLFKKVNFCENGQNCVIFLGQNDVIAQNFGVGRKYTFLELTKKLFQ